jgi:hypothetical protein
MSVLAQTASFAADSDDSSDGMAVEGVSPTTEEKLHIMSDGASAESLMARNSGLKPISRGSSRAASPSGGEVSQSAAGTTTSGQAETSASAAATAAPTSVQNTPAAAQTGTAVTTAVEAESNPETEQATVQTEAESSQTETAAAAAESTSVTDQATTETEAGQSQAETAAATATAHAPLTTCPLHACPSALLCRLHTLAAAATATPRGFTQ